MTAANGFKDEDRSGVSSALRRCGRNTLTALERLVQPQRRPIPLWPYSARQSAAGAVVLIAVIVPVMWLFDAPIVRGATQLPNWIRWPFYELTDFGKSGWVLWPIGLLFLALAALPSATTRISQAVMAALIVRVGFMFLAVALPGLFVAIIKRVIGRARPLVDGGPHPFAFEPFSVAAYASMPSGHATTAFSILVALGSLWPRARTALWLYALAIAASRVVVSAHYLSDVLAGAVVGTVGALLVRRYFAGRRLLFGEAPDGTLTVYPGPSWRLIRAAGRDMLAD